MRLSVARALMHLFRKVCDGDLFSFFIFEKRGLRCFHLTSPPCSLSLSLSLALLSLSPPFPTYPHPKIIAQDGNLMTSHNLGTAVGPTVFPGLAIQKCALVLEYVVSHYPEIFRNLESEVGGTMGESSSSGADSLSASAGSEEPDRLSRLTAILGSASLSEPATSTAHGGGGGGGGLMRF